MAVLSADDSETSSDAKTSDDYVKECIDQYVNLEDPYFFFNDTETTEIYTLSLHDALPISLLGQLQPSRRVPGRLRNDRRVRGDRKSTRLNSSHVEISYAVFCLKKKKIGILAQMGNKQHIAASMLEASVP